MVTEGVSANCRFSVAVHIMSLLGIRSDCSMTSEAIATSVNTNPVVVRRILSQLRKAGLVDARCGVGGGTLLARRPELIPLDLIHAAVEEARAFRVHERPNAACAVGREIGGVLERLFIDADDAVRKALAKHTLADVIKDIQMRSGLTAKAARAGARQARERFHTT